MNICFDRDDLIKYLDEAALVSKEYPVTVSKFFQKSQEVELDSVAQKGITKASVISEHIEYAGVHSGDATIALPAQTIIPEIQEKIKGIGKKLARELQITGPHNIQFLVLDNEVYIIEVNLRASRTFPFIAKVTGINMVSMFVDALFSKDIKEITVPKIKFVAVKVAQFSFARLIGAHPQLGVEMASTGEVACFGKDLEEAFLKGIISTGGKIPEKGIFISLGGDNKKKDLLESAKLLTAFKIPIYATLKTAKYLNENNVKAKMLYKIHEKKSPNILDYFQNKKIDLVINIADLHIKKEVNDDFAIRRMAADSNIFLLTKIKNAKLFLKALTSKSFDDLEVKAWSEYL